MTTTFTVKLSIKRVKNMKNIRLEQDLNPIVPVQWSFQMTNQASWKLVLIIPSSQAN